MMRIAATTLGLLLVLFLPATAAADGQGPCTFSGTARLDNTEVTEGTLITAIVDGDAYHTHTSTGYGYSTYSLTISAPNGKNYPEGTKVTFEVNGHPTGETAIFKSGANVRVDLTASTAAASSPFNAAIISGLIGALLSVGAAFYYFFFHRRGVRIIDWLDRKSDLPAGKTLPSVGKSEEQPPPAYVWNNMKLAWVENPAQAKSKLRTKKSVTSNVKAGVAVAGVGTSRQAKQDESIAIDGDRRTINKKQTIPTSGRAATDDPEMLVLYDGIVILLVQTSLTQGPLLTFTTHVRELRRTYQISIRKIEAVSRQSVRFELLLQRPLPLLKILKALPEVDTASAAFRGNRNSHPAAQTASGINTRTILVKLKDPNRYAVRNTRSTLNTRTIEVQLK